MSHWSRCPGQGPAMDTTGCNGSFTYIVHRDIKPANLLVTKTGVVKILDFGLAKLAGSEGVTQTGTTVGTVAYMSPEQARGQEVDHRTDIWSLGVVLYEMLAGRPPFQGETLAAIVHATLEHRQPPLSGASSPVQGAVTRALSKDKSERHHSVADLLTELRALRSDPDAATVATAAEADVPSIAVLPFRNMSADPEQEFFCEGIAEELIDALARLEGLRVVARTSAFHFKGQSPDLREVGEKLNVKTILEGSVRKSANRLRINAQLINAENGYHLWSERYDRTMGDVFAVQDDIARAVVSHLKVTLLGLADSRLVQEPADNMEVYNLCLQGRHHSLKLTQSGYLSALDCFGRALEAEPSHARAHAGAAIVHARLGMFGAAAPHDVMPKAKREAQAALNTDPNCAEAHLALAHVLHWYEWDWAAAEREYLRTFELNPAEAPGRSQYALLLSEIGRADDAVAEARRAVTLDPVSPFTNERFAAVFMLLGRLNEAIAQARAALAFDQNNWMAHFVLGYSTFFNGQVEEGLAAVRHALDLSNDDVIAVATLAAMSSLAGQTDQVEVIAKLHELRNRRYVSAALIAMVQAAFEQRDEAIAWMERAYRDRDGMLVMLQVHPGFDPLRSDPRFQALLKKMNFPASAESANG